MPRSAIGAGEAEAGTEEEGPPKSNSSLVRPISTFSRPLSDKGPNESAPEGGLDANFGDSGGGGEGEEEDAAVDNLVRGSDAGGASS